MEFPINYSNGLLVAFEKQMIAKRLTNQKEIIVKGKKYSVSGIDQNGYLISEYPYQDDNVFSLSVEFFILFFGYFIQYFMYFIELLKCCCGYCCCCCSDDD